MTLTLTLTLAASCGVEAGENFPPSFVYTENLQERERERGEKSARLIWTFFWV